MAKQDQRGADAVCAAGQAGSVHRKAKRCRARCGQRAQRGRVCPLDCGAGKVEQDGRLCSQDRSRPPARPSRRSADDDAGTRRVKPDRARRNQGGSAHAGRKVRPRLRVRAVQRSPRPPESVLATLARRPRLKQNAPAVGPGRCFISGALPRDCSVHRGDLQLVAHRVSDGGLVAVGENQRRAVGRMQRIEVDAVGRPSTAGNSSFASSWVMTLM